MVLMIHSCYLTSRDSDKEYLIGKNDAIIIIKETVLCR